MIHFARKTNAIRQKDKRGRHTTSTSFMFELESGGFVIDSPGLRAVQAWADVQAIDDTFSEIADLAQHCRFGDCKHEGEPGCAVQAKLEALERVKGQYPSLFYQWRLVFS